MERKQLRLKNWNYSTQGAYFLTINVTNRTPVFGWVEHGVMMHNQWGILAVAHIEKIPQLYESVYLDGYMVMPNHVHLLLRIDNSVVGGASYAPHPIDVRNKQRVPSIIQGTKAAITKAIKAREGRSAYDALPTKRLWQTSYYDHIVRNEKEHLEILNYIQTNPLRWSLAHPTQP